MHQPLLLMRVDNKTEALGVRQILSHDFSFFVCYFRTTGHCRVVDEKGNGALLAFVSLLVPEEPLGQAFGVVIFAGQDQVEIRHNIPMVVHNPKYDHGMRVMNIVLVRPDEMLVPLQ